MNEKNEIIKVMKLQVLTVEFYSLVEDVDLGFDV